MFDANGLTTRRRFFGLLGGSAAAAMLSAHDLLAARPFLSVERRGGPEGLIAGLRLLTATPLETMKAYYCDTMGMKLLEQSNRVLTVVVGSTTITFEPTDAGMGAPFYHVAFNIPEQKILAAADWQRERTPLFETPSHMRDDGYPDDVRHFRTWNAHSVFFFDPAGNVLEHIARHDLPSSRGMGTTGDGFGPADMLYASEIAFMANDVQALAGELRSALGVGDYRPGSDAFQALGDERGLLLIFRTGRQIGQGSGRDVPCKVFPTHATIRGKNAKHHEIADYPYGVEVKA